MSALVAEVHKIHSSDTYLAGLWKDDLHHGLIWIPAKQRVSRDRWSKQSTDSDIPSWSWAPFSGPIQYQDTLRLQLSPAEAVAELKNMTLKLPSSNLYGRVGKLELSILSWVREISVSEVRPVSHSDRDLLLRTDRNDEHKYKFPKYLEEGKNGILIFDAIKFQMRKM